jgi:hypothetical protein
MANKTAEQGLNDVIELARQALAAGEIRQDAYDRVIEAAGREQSTEVTINLRLSGARNLPGNEQVRQAVEQALTEVAGRVNATVERGSTRVTVNA